MGLFTTCNPPNTDNTTSKHTQNTYILVYILTHSSPDSQSEAFLENIR